MNLISVLPGILTIEFCLLNLTHCSCSLRIISLAECGNWDISQTIHSMSVALFVPSINYSLTCVSLHVDQACTENILHCKCNVSCAFQVTSESCLNGQKMR